MPHLCREDTGEAKGSAHTGSFSNYLSVRTFGCIFKMNNGIGRKNHERLSISSRVTSKTRIVPMPRTDDDSLQVRHSEHNYTQVSVPLPSASENNAPALQ
jgi:hypothetical protein